MEQFHGAGGLPGLRTHQRELVCYVSALVLRGIFNYTNFDQLCTWYYQQCYFFTELYRILPSNDKDFSAASLAFKRRQSADYRKECHICKSVNTTPHSMHANCAFCTLSFCELCLEAYYELDWVEIVRKQSGWKCTKCQGRCLCDYGKSRALTNCITSKDDHCRRLSLPAPVRDNHEGHSHPESVNYRHEGDADYDTKQLTHEIVVTNKGDDHRSGNSNDQESLIMGILASATDGNSIEVDLLIQEILASSAADQSQKERPKGTGEVTIRASRRTSCASRVMSLQVKPRPTFPPTLANVLYSRQIWEQRQRR